jgi:hypothetical protein
MYRILAQQFPNNETRLTFSSVPNGKDPFKDDPDEDNNPPVNLGSIASDRSDLNSDQNQNPPLSLVLNSKTERSSAGYGELPVKPTKFGLNARRSLLRAGGALEKTAPTEEVLFLTGTLPGSTEDSFRTIAAYSGYIVNSLKAWISTYARQKLDFYVWEYQKRGALHLHYAVHISDGASRRYILDAFHGWWVECLHRVSELGKCDLFRKNAAYSHISDTSKVRAVAEVCRKSVARYLAKYLSKSVAPKRGAARAFTPSRWWGVSRPLKTLTDSMIRVCEVIEGGYHATRRVWEEMTHVCDSSESVTHRYRHLVGEGSTVVMYTSEQAERESIWDVVISMQTGKQVISTTQTKTPSMVLRAVRDKQARFLRDASMRLSPSFQGLKNSLDESLSWTLKLTPSTSAEPLSLLLAWAARLSDIRYISRCTPAMTYKEEREIGYWLDELEWAINEVAENGWS